MAVALRGYTQAVYDADGAQSVAWPAGTVVGDYAVLCMLEPQSGTPNSKPDTATGWLAGPSSGNSTVWGAFVTSSMLAAALPVTGNVAFLATFSACGGIGRTAKSNGTQLTKPGAGLFVFVRDDTRTSTLTPAGGKLGTDVLNGKNRNRRSNVWFIAHTTTGFKKLSSTNASYFTSLELLPAVAPSAPTLVAPVAGAYVDPAATQTFTARHNHASMPQARINLRIREKTGPGAWSYLQPGGTLSGSSSSTATDVGSMTMSAAQLTAGVVYEWQMQTAVDDNGSPLWSAWSDLRDLTAANPPTVTSVTVTASAGDLTPDVAWARTLGTGSQVAWQVRVTPSAAGDSSQLTMWDSGVTPGADLGLTLGALDWVNGSSYKAWVRVQQTGGQWSAWTSGTFTVSWTAPTAPSSVTFTQGTPPTLTVAGVSGRNYVRAEYSQDSGATWVVFAEVPVTAASMDIRLPLAPYGVARLYGARGSDTVDGTEQWSARTVTGAAVASTDESAYLVTDDGGTWLPVRVRADSNRRRVEPISVSYGLTADGEAPTAAVDYQPPQGWTGTTTLLGMLPADRDAIVAFWDAHKVFWVRWPAERRGADIYDGGSLRVARVSPVGLDRIVPSNVTPRDLAFDWVQQ